MKKKTVLESLKDFLQNVQNIFFHFLFRFLLKTKKTNTPPFAPPPFSLHFGGGSSAASPLEIWDVMPPYLKKLFEQKNRNLTILTIFAQTTLLTRDRLWHFLSPSQVRVKVKSPLRLHTQLVTPNHWLVIQRMNMR